RHDLAVMVRPVPAIDWRPCRARLEAGSAPDAARNAARFRPAARRRIIGQYHRYEGKVLTTFWIFGALMLAIALLFVLPPLLRKGSGAPAHAQRDEINLAVLRDQSRELDADLAAGTIDASAHESARHELEHRVAEDVQPSAPLTRGRGQRLAALLVGITVVIGAVAFY